MTSFLLRITTASSLALWGLLPACTSDDGGSSGPPADAGAGGGQEQEAGSGGAAAGGRASGGQGNGTGGTAMGGRSSGGTDGGTTDAAAGGTDAGAADSSSGGAGNDAAPGTLSASCYLAVDHLCDEWVNASAGYVAETVVSCANRGGVHASPADCPTADFVGKCTLPAVPSGEVLTTRHYTGADVGAQESFCTGIGGGAWSTSP